jgi:16S rRNA (uracil1498-N3)-methyltransferase
MHRFLHPDSLSPATEVTLSADESHHLARVVRIGEGETVELVNGAGFLALATVLRASPKQTRVRIERVTEDRRPPRVHLGFGLPKSTALDFILRRCTEVGVASFQPLVTQHSQSFSSWNQGRWEKIMVEVAKQCQALHFPHVIAPVPLADWLGRRMKERLLLLCDEEDRQAEIASSGSFSEIDLLVGAEGGWSRPEVDALRAAGARAFGLGRQRLRAETAALVSLALVKKLIGDL